MTPSAGFWSGPAARPHYLCVHQAYGVKNWLLRELKYVECMADLMSCLVDGC